MATVELRRLIRRARRAVTIRRWSLQKKIAIGIWIPVIVVAVALFTGPNRSVASPRPAAPHAAAAAHVAPKVTTTTAPPGAPDPSLGPWLRGRRHLTHTSSGNAAHITSQAALQLQQRKLIAQRAALLKTARHGLLRSVSTRR